jgi:NitT/TauT family transport system permease protein
VIVCVIISLFPIIANTLFGLLSADQGHHDLFRLHGAGRWTRLWKLQFPGALPAIFTGLRISAGLSVIGAIVGDFFFRRGAPGLGVLITTYQSRLQMEQTFGALILAILLGIVTFWAFGLIGRKVVGSWADNAD